MSTYKQLAVQWLPDSQNNRAFVVIVVATLVCLVGLSLILSSVEVPEKERRLKRVVPERVAKFIDQKKKPIEQPKPKVKPKPPPPKPKPKVARKTVEEKDKKPLTEIEQKARDKAKDSGVLSLAAELNDLIDTSSIDKSITGKIKKSGASAKVAALSDDSLLSQGVGTGSGGVDDQTVGQTVGVSALSQTELASIQSGLGKRERTAADEKKAVTRESSNRKRSEEELSVVFDQNKAKLYYIYNRARQKNLSLKGKIVIELTIAPIGNVTSARILSSELGDPKLERRILARVKGFKFKDKDVEEITVTFPIEFVPS